MSALFFRRISLVLPGQKAAVSSFEGEAVDYSLGPDYSVSFTIGSLMAQRRLQMEDFRIIERPSPMLIPAPTWFVTVDLVFAYFPMAWIGQRLADRVVHGPKSF